MNQQSQPAFDRRPIAAREYSLSKRGATLLASWGLSANAISVIGMILGILAGILLGLTGLVENGAGWLWFFGGLFILCRLGANMFDGMVAVATGTASPVGELYNEVPDRVSDSAILIGAGYALGGSVILGFAAALAAIFTAYIRALGKGAGAKQEFCGPMAKQQRMFTIVAVAFFHCLWTSGEKTLGFLSDAMPFGLMALALAIITIGAAYTAIRRLDRVARQLRGITR